MTVGKYYDAHEDGESCNYFDRRGGYIIYCIVEHKACEWESKLKNSSYSGRNGSEAITKKTVSEDISNKYNKQK